MKRHLFPAAVLCACVLAACSGKSSSHASGTTSTTDASGYTTAYTVCLQFYNTETARNAEPPTLTDAQADDVFVGLALQMKPAMQKDPRAWSKLNAAAATLRKQLLGTTASDQQIEDTITKMADACKPARTQPKQPTVDIQVSTTTSTTAAPI